MRLGDFFVNHLKAHADDGKGDNTMRVPSVDIKGFELLLRFGMTKTLHLHRGLYPGPEHKLDGYVSFLDTALVLGFWIKDGVMESIKEKFKQVLIMDRYALKGRHIRFAYDYSKPKNPKEAVPSRRQGQDGVRNGFLKPLQDLFVKSATKCYVEYRNDPLAPLHAGPVYDSDDEGIDVARRDAFNTGFRFDRELERIPRFKYHLLESFGKHTLKRLFCVGRTKLI